MYVDIVISNVFNLNKHLFFYFFILCLRHTHLSCVDDELFRLAVVAVVAAVVVVVDIVVGQIVLSISSKTMA